MRACYLAVTLCRYLAVHHVPPAEQIETKNSRVDLNKIIGINAFSLERKAARPKRRLPSASEHPSMAHRPAPISPQGPGR